MDAQKTYSFLDAKTKDKVKEALKAGKHREAGRLINEGLQKKYQEAKKKKD